MKTIKSLPIIFYIGLLLFGITNILEQFDIILPVFEFLRGISCGFVICGAFLTILSDRCNWLERFKHAKHRVVLK